MAKIDLSGNSRWQSKSGDKIKALQEGAYDYQEIILKVGDIDLTWVQSGLIVQVIEGQISLKLQEEVLEYEKNQIIYLNEENITNLEVVITEDTKLGVFKEKS